MQPKARLLSVEGEKVGFLKQAASVGLEWYGSIFS